MKSIMIRTATFLLATWAVLLVTTSPSPNQGDAVAPAMELASGFFASGGTDSTASGLAVDSTVGEVSSGDSSSPNFGSSSGFWSAAACVDDNDGLNEAGELAAGTDICAYDSDNDTHADGADNCATTPNGPAQASVVGVGNQTDSDADGLPGTQPPPGGNFGGNACDVDDDNDTLPDTMDQCRISAEDYDGFEDGDGCPDSDNDLDGVCDPGLVSLSCSGSDTGQQCFDPAGTLFCPTQSCRNIAEDIDAFKDADGCPEPDNDNDGKVDAADVCPGTNAHTGADGMLGSPQDLNHNGKRDDPPEGVFTLDDVVQVFEDYDGVLDGDGCHDSPGEDFDGDGYTDDNEALFIGTNAGYPCGINGWPSNLNDAGFSANALDILDVTSFVAPVRRFDKSPGDPGFSVRWDIKPGPTGFPKYINITDVTTLVAGPTGNPPMLNGARAFGKDCPLPPG